MLFRFTRILAIAALIMMGCVFCYAQVVEERNPSPTTPGSLDRDKDDSPKGFKESLEKMRIDKDKKDHDQMVERGQEALTISEELEKAYSDNGRLTEKEMAKLAEVEKLVKKVRSELGGEDDDGTGDQPSQTQTLSQGDAVKTLREAAVSLCDELKKTTRFTISAAAIQGANVVIRLARFIRISH